MVEIIDCASLYSLNSSLSFTGKLSRKESQATLNSSAALLYLLTRLILNATLVGERSTYDGGVEAIFKDTLYREAGSIYHGADDVVSAGGWTFEL
jgi:hypothetical protein